MTQIFDKIKEIKQSGAPVCHYIYDLNALRQHVHKIVSSLPENCEMYYAMKANSEDDILATMSESVAGFEVASQGEIQKGLAYKSEPYYFWWPRKNRRRINVCYRSRHSTHSRGKYI